MNYYTTFTTREEYLKLSEEWKKEYEALSAEIRSYKKDAANWHRKHFELAQLKSHEQRAALNKAASAQYSAWSNSNLATRMLEERKAMKQEAQVQYLASKEISV